MQSYIGVFYHILLHRDFKTLRQVLIQRLIVSLVRKEFLVSFLYFRFFFFLDLMCSWLGMFSRCWKIWWKTLYPISNTVTENMEFGMLLSFIIMFSALEYGMPLPSYELWNAYVWFMHLSCLKAQEKTWEGIINREDPVHFSGRERIPETFLFSKYWRRTWRWTFWW